MRSLCLLIAVLTMTGCGSATKPSTSTTLPDLDSSLAADCQEVQRSSLKDYDAWQAETDQILAILTDCAVRHHQTVEAFRRLRAVMAEPQP